MTRSFCDGPHQDDCGAWYCPMSPEIDPTEEVCRVCKELHGYAVDREIDRREFEERRKIRWGDS